MINYKKSFEDYFESEKPKSYIEKTNGLNVYSYNPYNVDMVNTNELDNYVGDDEYEKIALRGTYLHSSKLSKVFFSKENIEKMQYYIKKYVFKLTQGKYKLTTDQNEMDLVNAMREMYVNNSKYLNTHIDNQVKELNRQTLEDILPNIISNIKQNDRYIKTITNPPQLLERPINTSVYGSKSQPINFW